MSYLVRQQITRSSIHDEFVTKTFCIFVCTVEEARGQLGLSSTKYLTSRFIQMWYIAAVSPIAERDSESGIESEASLIAARIW